MRNRSFMLSTRSLDSSLLALVLALLLAGGGIGARATELRRTPIVKAIASAAPSVVNIQGQKTQPSSANNGEASDAPRLVNGMGTGVVIDQRGYILTNFHVVDGVRQINVTLSDGRLYTARLVNYHRRSDLAVIKIRTKKSLPIIRVGSSRDLLTGEPVIAVGNAYGYEHTVTRGIISALHRDVQVNETQQYLDLIQTDASINPGNSGGPLLNIDGEMIGVNVAVRAGAQGIGFAIPVDKAMSIAARLLTIEHVDRNWHGLVTEASDDGGFLPVKRVESGSPAAKAGLRAGDRVARIGPLATKRPLDIERALLHRKAGDRVTIEIERDGDDVTLELTVAGRRGSQGFARRRTEANEAPASGVRDQVWEIFGVRLQAESAASVRQRNSRFAGGLRVTAVRRGGPAAQEGIQIGDILVGVHRWQTSSSSDIEYIVTRGNLARVGEVKFFILRNGETLFGHLDLAQSSVHRRTQRR